MHDSTEALNEQAKWLLALLDERGTDGDKAVLEEEEVRPLLETIANLSLQIVGTRNFHFTASGNFPGAPPGNTA